MTCFLQFLKREAFLTVLVLVCLTTVLVAQITPPSNKATPAGSGQMQTDFINQRTQILKEHLSISPARVVIMNDLEYDRYFNSFISLSNLHNPDSRLDDILVDACKNDCVPIHISFLGANVPIIPDNVLFYDQKSGKIIGGLDYRDFVIGKTTEVLLKPGIYVMKAVHHLYDDITISDMVIGPGNNYKFMNLQFGPTKKEIPNPLWQKFSIDYRNQNAYGFVWDVSTGLPLPGVKVTISKYYSGYSGLKDHIAFTDKRGMFIFEKPVAPCTEGLDVVSDYSGRSGCVLKFSYELPGFEEDFNEDVIADPNIPGAPNKAFNLFGIGYLRPISPAQHIYPVQQKKLRIAGKQTPTFLNDRTLLSCALPTNIRVGINCPSGNCLKCTVYKINQSPNLNFDVYVKTVLSHEWNNSWGNYQDGISCLKAGAVAVKTIGAKYQKTPLTSTYDIGSDICNQKFTTARYQSMLNNPQSYPNIVSAVDDVTGWVLRSSNTFPKSEYAAETNDNLTQGNCNSNYDSKKTCGDGYFQKANDGYSGGCYPVYGVEYVSLGYSDCKLSHPRGISQRGSFRWATGRSISNTNVVGSDVILPKTFKGINYCKKNWQQLLGHYFNYYSLENCSTGEIVTLSGVSQTCNSPQPNLTDNGSSKTSSGRYITVTARVKNTQNVSAGPFHTGYWLSTDISFGNDYGLADLFYTGGLSGNGTSTYTFTSKAPSNVPPGYYYILEFIDYQYNVNESIENDNGWYLGSPIYLPYALSDGIDDRSRVVGMITIPVTVENNESELLQNDQDVAIPILSNEFKTCIVDVHGLEISVSNVDPQTTYLICNSIGQVIQQEKAVNGTIYCRVSLPGIYYLSMINEIGYKCTQKVFVNY